MCVAGCVHLGAFMTPESSKPNPWNWWWDMSGGGNNGGGGGGGGGGERSKAAATPLVRAARLRYIQKALPSINLLLSDPTFFGKFRFTNGSLGPPVELGEQVRAREEAQSDHTALDCCTPQSR